MEENVLSKKIYQAYPLPIYMTFFFNIDEDTIWHWILLSDSTWPKTCPVVCENSRICWMQCLVWVRVAVLSGSCSGWCSSGVVGGGATWQSLPLPPLPPPTPAQPVFYPLHKSTLSATGHRWPGQAAKSCHLLLCWNMTSYIKKVMGARLGILIQLKHS